MELTIGKRVITPNKLIDKFVITFSSMHGDADAYTKNSGILDRSQQQLIIDLHELRKIAQLNQGYLTSDSDWKNAIQIKPYLTEALNFLLDGMLDWDNQSDGQFRCTLDSITVRYFDDQGIEFEVNVVDE